MRTLVIVIYGKGDEPESWVVAGLQLKIVAEDKIVENKINDIIQEWEQTQLRAVFLDEMARVQPEWVEVHRAGVLRNDFYAAVMYCDDELCRRRVRQWVDEVERMTDEELQSCAQGEEYVSLNAMLSA